MIDHIAQLKPKIYTNKIGTIVHITAIVATTSSQYCDMFFMIYHDQIGVAIFVNIAGINIANITPKCSFNFIQLQKIKKLCFIAP
jgi:hypothetical protein